LPTRGLCSLNDKLGDNYLPKNKENVFRQEITTYEYVENGMKKTTTVREFTNNDHYDSTVAHVFVNEDKWRQ
jgi:hypothetical protein